MVGTSRAGDGARHAASRFLVAQSIADEAARLAGEHHDATDLFELTFLAGLPDLPDTDDERAARAALRTAAQQILAVIATGTSTPRAAAAEALPDVGVTVLRMGPPRLGMQDDSDPAAQATGFGVELALGSTRQAPAAIERLPGGYPRRRIGLALTDDAATAWESARGYWSMTPDADYLVPTRYGFAPFVFRVENWQKYTSVLTGRDLWWARDGWLIDAAAGTATPLRERAPADDATDGELGTGSLYELAATAEPASPRDLDVAHVLAGAVLGLGKRGANPVLRLRRRATRA